MNINELESYCSRQWYYDVRDQLKNHIYKRAAALFKSGDAARAQFRNTEELENYQAKLREKFIESLGGLPSSDSPLNPKITGTVQGKGYSIEKVIFESRPGNYVTSNLYIPDGVTNPTAAVIFVSGHNGDARLNDEYQTVCQYLVNSGLIVLAQDPIGQGERYSYYEPSIGRCTVQPSCPEHDYAGLQCWPAGDSPARYFVHDIIRGIDYLCTRPEVDPIRIGVTGNSGGGTQTSLAMLCDPRIAAAAPATFIMDRESFMRGGMAQDNEQIWPGTTAWGFDHADILLSMAPKPVLVLAARWDYFQIEGTRSTVEKTKHFWAMYGVADNLQLYEDDSTHCYSVNMAKAAAAFFSEYLLENKLSAGKSEPHKTVDIKPFNASELWCTEHGQVRADIAGSRFTFEENLDRIKLLSDLRAAMPEAERKDKAMAWLKEKVFYGRLPCDLNPRHHTVFQLNDLTATYSMWFSQTGVFNSALTFTAFNYSDRKLPAVIAIWDKGTSCLQSHMVWIRKTCNSGKAVIVPDLSGMGSILPNPLNFQQPLEDYGVIFKLSHELVWMDDSLVALRIYDMLRLTDALEYFNNIDTKDIMIYAYGCQGLYGRLAYLLDQRIKGIEVVNGMESYESWAGSRYYETHEMMSIVLPGALKYFDIPDVDCWSKNR